MDLVKIDQNGNATLVGNIVFLGDAGQQIVGDGENAISLNFSNGALTANIAGGIVANFVELVLTDGSRQSVLFGARQLADSQGNIVMTWDGDVQLVPGRAIRMVSPNGTLYRITVDDNGNVLSVAV